MRGCVSSGRVDGVEAAPSDLPIYKMILTQCPVCAAPLPPTSAKQCSRCKTRYCGPACQKKHWEEGGHDKLCRKIRKGGGAEQYYADKKCAEAVAVAVEACADDTKGQRCYICTEAVHRHTGEGLVRGCACHTTEGFVHVSCLAEQAKILVAEAEEKDLDDDAVDERFKRWYTCSLCEQQYHGVVCHALGWACWKTYVGRPDDDFSRFDAMMELGNGLQAVGRYEEMLGVLGARSHVEEYHSALAPEMSVLRTKASFAICYKNLGRKEEALAMFREVYAEEKALYGIEDRALWTAVNLSSVMYELGRIEEARSFLSEHVGVARRELGPDHAVTLNLLENYALSIADTHKSIKEVCEAVEMLGSVMNARQRIFGNGHPDVVRVACKLHVRIEAMQNLLEASESA